MSEQNFIEKDWKLFRNKIGDWQESYMDKLNKEYIELLNTDARPSEKFWSLEKRIRKDQSKVGVCAEMSRSQLIHNIVSLINEGVISIEDLEEFSSKLKETINAILKH